MFEELSKMREENKTHTEIMIVFIRTVTAVVISVTETPTSDTLVVVAAESSLRVTVDGVADGSCLVRCISTIIVTITLPLRCDTDLQHTMSHLKNRSD